MAESRAFNPLVVGSSPTAPTKLELGAGLRPTRGYLHNDAQPFPHIEIVGDPWMIDLPDDSLDEVLALAFIEHLTYEQALDTFRNVHRMLKPGGVFLFDVPDYPEWVRYYTYHLSLGTEYARDADQIPDLDHIRRTLFGWGRWPGDSHLYGWDAPHLGNTLADIGFTIGRDIFDALPLIRERAYRQRFDRPWDAHLYVGVVK